MGGYLRMRSWMAAAFIAGVAVLWLSVSQFHVIDSLQFVGGAPMPPVSSSHELVQTITAEDDSISRVDLILRKPDPDADGQLLFELVEVLEVGTDGTLRLGDTLEEVTYETESFGTEVTRRFEFDPVPLVPGHAYAIRLTSDDPEDIAVSPGAIPGNGYSGGRLYIDGESTEADLYLGIFHSEGAGGLLEKVEPWRPPPSGNKVLFIALFAIGAAAFGWLLWEVAGSTDDTIGPAAGERGHRDEPGEPTGLVGGGGAAPRQDYQ